MRFATDELGLCLCTANRNATQFDTFLDVFTDADGFPFRIDDLSLVAGNDNCTNNIVNGTRLLTALFDFLILFPCLCIVAHLALPPS